VSTGVGLSNLILGLVYTSYGIMTVIDMAQHGRTRGFSHFGLAWTFMAFTCGPHHVEHGLHVLFHGGGGSLDLAVVLVGFPAGVVWVLLRVEALTGGRGDRIVSGTPPWVEVIPTAMGAYLVALASATAATGVGRTRFDARLVPNLLLVGLYCAIGAVLLRTQIENHRYWRSWSISGLALTLVFPTCAVMHGVYALYESAGNYVHHSPLLVIDTFAVPAAAYFLWVVWSLYRGSIDDWNAARDSQVEPGALAEEPLGI
jgi:hypothetical protein